MFHSFRTCGKNAIIFLHGIRGFSMESSDKFSAQNYTVCAVALYGSYEPFFFKGHLSLRTYYKDNKRVDIDLKKTSDYFVDTLFYETNKIIRTRERDRYDEQRNLVIQASSLLGEPYQIVFNRSAAPGAQADNSLAILKDTEPDAKGLALVIKKTGDDQYTWLEEEEARTIENALKAILNR